MIVVTTTATTVAIIIIVVTAAATAVPVDRDGLTVFCRVPGTHYTGVQSPAQPMVSSPGRGFLSPSMKTPK